MEKFNTRAFVLKSVNFKDTDKIYTLFTEDKGKITAMAKGVRKINSRRSGSLDTLNLVEVQISVSNGQFNYIMEVKPINSYLNLKNDFEISKHVFYILEIINRFIFEDYDIKNIFQLLYQTLSKLQEKKEMPIVLTNKFEMKFMELLGYKPKRDFVLLWQKYMKEKRFTEGDNMVKNYIAKMLQEQIKSLELI